MSAPVLPSLRAQAGAVNPIWLIVVVILWLGTLAFTYATLDDVAQLQETASAATASQQRMSDRLDQANDRLRTLSEVVGHRNPADFSSVSDAVAIQGQLDAAKALLGADLGGPDTKVTVDQAMAALVSQVQATRTAAQAAKADFEAQRVARAAAEQKVAEIENTYRDQVSALQRQLQEEQQRADAQAAADQRRIDEITADQQAADEARQAAEQELASVQAEARRQASTAAATIKALEVRRQPKAPEAPDGELLAVNDRATMGWVDIGRVHGLAVGTRFELLRRASNGELRPRGKVEVKEVDRDMALVALVGTPNALDPMLPGDLVRSPSFSRNETLHYYLLGQFPLDFSKEFVGERLRELGQVVDASIGTGTDVLVLGEPDASEGEFAQPLTDSDEYQLADRLGLRILRLDDLREFLRR